MMKARTSEIVTLKCQGQTNLSLDIGNQENYLTVKTISEKKKLSVRGNSP